MAFRNNNRLPVYLHSARQAIEQTVQPHEYKDTDPQMLFALWDMEKGIDPDTSLEQIEGAEVLYDKFAPRLSRRR